MFDFSSFFGGSSSGGFGLSGLSSINFSDYRMIKSGSYKKLMKAYYSEQDSGSSKTSGTSASKSKKTSGKSVAEQIIDAKMHGNIVKDSTGLTKAQSQASALKKAAEAFGEEGALRQEDGSYDAEKAVKSINDFASKYNAMLDQAGKVTTADVAKEVDYMKSMTNTMKKDLEKIGITIGDDGKLSVKEETLKNANAKDVEGLFSGYASYAGEIAEKAADIGHAAFMASSIYSGSGSVYSTASSSTYSSTV